MCIGYWRKAFVPSFTGVPWSAVNSSDLFDDFYTKTVIGLNSGLMTDEGCYLLQNPCDIHIVQPCHSLQSGINAIIRNSTRH